MKKLLYPLLASALITIVPFLLSFEKGQDIVRGLFGFEYFVILLLWVSLKSRKFEWRWAKIFQKCLLAFLSISLLAVAFVDLSNLWHIKGWDFGFYVLVPFVTCAVALVIVSKVPSFGVRGISFILFVSLVFHLAFKNFYPAQPLLQMPVVDYLARSVVHVDRKILPENFKAKYDVTDSVTITRDFIDTSKTNVVILIESWGIPISEERFEKELSIFNGVSSKVGVHARMYSRTRTAEREDLIYEIHRDSLLRRDTVFIPKVLDSLGVQTFFFSGGDSLEYWRFRYIRNVGFREICFADSLSDSLMAQKIESALLDSTKKFIAWTTRDTKFPIQASSLQELDSTYFVKLEGTLNLVADLARRFPSVRFIVQGDHEPILSMLAFQEKFYKRFVPYVILN
jgi:hypothetical protein